MYVYIIYINSIKEIFMAAVIDGASVAVIGFSKQLTGTLAILQLNDINDHLLNFI